MLLASPSPRLKPVSAAVGKNPLRLPHGFPPDRLAARRRLAVLEQRLQADEILVHRPPRIGAEENGKLVADRAGGRVVVHPQVDARPAGRGSNWTMPACATGAPGSVFQASVR
jgi:hypothetical protein